MDRPRPECEPLPILIFFSEAPHDLITKTTFFTLSRKNPLKKNVFFGKFLIAKIYFEYFTVNYFGTYFLTIKKIQKAVDELGDLYTIN